MRAIRMLGEPWNAIWRVHGGGFDLRRDRMCTNALTQKKVSTHHTRSGSKCS